MPPVRGPFYSGPSQGKRVTVSKRLKIASWNINSVRARIALVERLIAQEQPDILCLQETKVVDGIFPADLFDRLGYTHRQLNGQRMHHGVAILSRLPLSDPGRHDWQDNGEARHIGVRLECGIRLENVYVPAGGDVPDRKANPKFGQKLDFLERMTRWSERLAEPTLIVGDFNVAPLECDVWSHKALLTVVSTPRSRSKPSGGSSKPTAGSTSAAGSCRRRNAASPGGAIARQTGRRTTAAAASTICGCRPSSAAMSNPTASSRAAGAGNARRTTSR